MSWGYKNEPNTLPALRKAGSLERKKLFEYKITRANAEG